MVKTASLYSNCWTAHIAQPYAAKNAIAWSDWLSGPSAPMSSILSTLPTQVASTDLPSATYEWQSTSVAPLDSPSRAFSSPKRSLGSVVAES
jgi:hypothetical protein